MEEPTHFTYARFTEQDDIAQGDILHCAPGLRQILEEVHPHFLDEKYTAFLVLTQTCDLVRRGENRCKSRYINLAVIRPLDRILRALCERLCNPVEISGNVIPGLFVRGERSKVEALLDRVFNQNEQAMGLFYLHPDASVRIAVPSVALLQVSIAVRAYEHYETLMKARTGRLKPEFQSKLGWLTGNLFARVATEDMPPDKRKELKEQLLEIAADSALPDASVQWVRKECIREAQRQRIVVDESSTAKKIAESLEQYRPRSPSEIASERVASVLKNVIPGLLPEQADKVKARLMNDSLFRATLKSDE